MAATDKTGFVLQMWPPRPDSFMRWLGCTADECLDIVPDKPCVPERRCPVAPVEGAGNRVTWINIHTDLGSSLLAEPMSLQVQQLAPDSSPAVLWSDKEILYLTVARKATRKVTSDVTDYRILDDGHMCDARWEGLLGVVVPL